MATINGNQKKLTVSGEAIESAVNSKHEHSNSAVLDKLSDNNGTLQYNGADITGGSATEYTLPTASETVLGGVKVDGSTITVTNGVIKSKQATIDSTLNSTSTNAIQNKAVNAALLNKQDKLTAGDNVTIANNKISVDLSGLGDANAPLVASTASEMADTSKYYVYSGNEEGYENGYVYYYKDSAWVKGWSYQGSSETTASKVKMADNTTVEDTVSSLKEDLVDEVTLESIGKVNNSVIYVNGTKLQKNDSTGTGYSYKVYSVKDCKKVSVSLKTVDRSGKTNLNYVLFTDVLSYPVKNDEATIVGKDLSTNESIEYVDKVINVPENCNYMYLLYDSNGAEANAKSSITIKEKINNLNASNIKMSNGNTIETEINNISNNKFTEISVLLEQGSFGNSHENVASSKTVRIKNTTVFEKGKRYRIELDKVYDVVVNVSGSNKFLTTAMFEFVALDKNVSIGIKNTDGTDITTSDVTMKLYKILNRSNGKYDIIVASKDATELEKQQADLICDGVNDEREIQCALNSNIFNSCACNVLLLGNYFKIDEFTNINTSNVTDRLGINAITIQKSFVLNGSYAVYLQGKCSGHLSKNSATQIIVSDPSKLSDELSYSIIGATRALTLVGDSNPEGAMIDRFDLNMDNIFISPNTLRKKIVSIDGCGFAQMSLTNCGVSWNSDYKVSDITAVHFDVEDNCPVEGLIGIRGVYGSNRGLKNYMKHCIVCGMYEGLAITGEHWIIEDCLEHHCYYGFTIGNHNCSKQMEHPIVFIGNSVEQCYQMGLLNRWGATERSEVDVPEQTIKYIGGSTEAFWGSTDGTLHPMLPIDEIVNGSYTGEIETDYIAYKKLFADNACKNLMGKDTSKLNKGLKAKRDLHGVDCRLEGDKYYATDEGKEYIFHNGQWV